ncbi:hypothetical protein [Calothrix sp. UHCC 0171]|uniref:hypothetical protein n=1 Tax=Calothrix sp. UHCC 0171 TaxID=3110245 RepID=UPI002B21552E|nr:hypothetical protein [Calothrix sp. UHCC 0171]MEA5572380.1 hypothetical protein [Calothrix sp. UHCC 0171]
MNETDDEALNKVADEDEGITKESCQKLQSQIEHLHSKNRLLSDTITKYSAFLEKIFKGLPTYIDYNSANQGDLDNYCKKVRDFEADFHILRNDYEEQMRKSDNQESQSKGLQTPVPHQPVIREDKNDYQYYVGLSQQSSQRNPEIVNLEKILISVIGRTLIPQLNKQLEEEKNNFHHQNQNVIKNELTPLEKKLQQIEHLLSQILSTLNQRETAENTALQTNIDNNNANRNEPTSQVEDTHQEINTVDTNNIPWLKEYNRNPDSFEQYAKQEVTITAESIHNRRLGSNQTVFLEDTRKGNYWVFANDNTIVTGKYLLPKANLKFTEYSLETIQFLFELTGNTSDNSGRFTIIKPAIVTLVEQGKWQLVDTGIIDFES